MLARLRSKLTYPHVVSTLALFVAVGTGGAYAANEWNSSNIQNETLQGVDVRGTNGTSTTEGTNGSLTGADISGQPAIPDSGQPFVNGSLDTYDITNNTLTGDDVQGNSLKGADIDESTLSSIGGGGPAGGDLTGSYPNPLIRLNAVASGEVVNNSLKGADVDEATLGQVPDADKLDSLDSTQLNPVAADGRTADFPLDIFNQTVLTATITTARTASLDVSAAVEVANTQTNTGGVTCYFEFDDFASSSPDFTTYAESLKETLPLVWVQGVAAGTHTVELRCSGATYLYVDDAGMSVSAHL